VVFFAGLLTYSRGGIYKLFLKYWLKLLFILLLRRWRWSKMEKFQRKERLARLAAGRAYVSCFISKRLKGGAKKIENNRKNQMGGNIRFIDD